MRRPSLASLDCGAESPGYRAVPSASADGDASAAPPQAGGAGVPHCAVSRLAPPGGPSRVTPTGAHPGQFAVAAKTASVSRLPGPFPALARGGHGDLPPGPAGQRDTRHGRVARLDHFRAGQDGCATTRDNSRHAGRRPAKRKMICKEHPCIYAADGYSMTRSASSWAAPRGPWLPPKLTDVHGREG